MQVREQRNGATPLTCDTDPNQIQCQKGGEALGIFPISVRAARYNAGLTATELGERLGVTKQTVIRWEQENRIPNREKVFRLAELAHVPADCIFLSMELPAVIHNER